LDGFYSKIINNFYTPMGIMGIKSTIFTKEFYKSLIKIENNI